MKTLVIQEKATVGYSRYRTTAAVARFEHVGDRIRLGLEGPEQMPGLAFDPAYGVALVPEWENPRSFGEIGRGRLATVVELTAEGMLIKPLRWPEGVDAALTALRAADCEEASHAYVPDPRRSEGLVAGGRAFPVEPKRYPVEGDGDA